MSVIEVDPLTPTIGAEIKGIDLRLPLTEAETHAQEGAEYLHRSLVVSRPNIGGAGNAACFPYPPGD